MTETRRQAEDIVGPHPATCHELPLFHENPHHRCLWVEQVEQQEARLRQLPWIWRPIAAALGRWLRQGREGRPPRGLNHGGPW